MFVNVQCDQNETKIIPMERNRTYARDGSSTRRNTTSRGESGGWNTVSSGRRHGHTQYRSNANSPGKVLFLTFSKF